LRKTFDSGCVVVHSELHPPLACEVQSDKLATPKKQNSMSLYIDYKYNKIIDIVMQTEIERNKGR